MGDRLQGVLDLVRGGDGFRGVFGFFQVGIGCRVVAGLRLQAVHLDGVPWQLADVSCRQQALVFKLVETRREPDAADAL
jgi:hypothetical protein